ncbi:MAG: type VI secretion system baseplate subunit TssF, partial [Oxalobacteraceae bacterium]
MDELLRYYEEELGLFGQFAREFRARYPKPAGELHLSGETYEDPAVARLIQSVALMSARIKKRLDDDYPKFTEALLESLYPHYLRPLPSYSVAQVGYRGDGETPQAPALLARGTMLRTGAGHATPCRHVGSSPACSQAPAQRKNRVSSSAGASLQAGDEPTWLPLAHIPLRLAGFDDADAMLPFPARTHPALRLLTEYFCYPEKFNFIDLDLDALRTLLPPRCTRFTLHLGVSGIAPDSDTAHLLSNLSPRNLLAGCTPVINLFPKAGAPLQLSYTSADYPLLADTAHAADYEIHSVDAVRLVRDSAGAAAVTCFTPLYVPPETVAGPDAPPERGLGRMHHWIVRRDHATAAVSPGHEMRIALVDADFRSTETAGATLSTDLTCSNRDAPM